MTENPNILLIILDSARAKNMSLYGYKRETTPFLEEFSEKATVYTQARAPSIHSIASHVSIFTGRHVEEHDAIHHTAEIDTDKTIWRELQSSSEYSTGLFTNNRIISSASNLSDCFDYISQPNYPISERLKEFTPLFEDAYYPGAENGISGIGGHTRRSLRDDKKLKSLVNCGGEQILSSTARIESFIDNPDSKYREIHGGEFTQNFLEWKTRQEGPWAACINLMDTHSPYKPQNQFNQWGEDKTWTVQNENKPKISELLDGTGWDRIKALESLYDGALLQADSILVCV
ncbi:sulfatase-like hydrolase/transferase [Natrialba sp. SSL1]|uniref:sulfatase-like hydrolase/transferase n=1 Tax=Natrialba sp. SSL1 TaxID=1869245 RepID=UPI0009FE9B57|nr:sulfatase-like hydrolase/transferase [Natrialba sp. SSL1]